ncbi:RING-H2 finger protein ATL52-like [Salvia hispanica]|uniref:RING-H2 finger protein ATL52-like n=1 Tax=Salvia hispanica TaxID=49212 RepID=UPI002009B108|nr:RING-H2 finger protein ATL52-like [Salvia hispanica]
MEGLSSPPTVQSGTNASFFNPLLISMLGIVATVIAIMAYHLLLANYCLKRRAANADAAQPPPPTGVDEKFVKSIPILAFSVWKRRRGVDQGGECAVCLGEFEDEDSVRLLPNCTHAFHVSCIDQWFAAHTSCPLCRMPVLRQETDSAPASPDLAVDPINRGESSSVEPSSMGQSVGLLRNCASLMTPMERRSSSARLKRSLSMDQSVVVIDVQRTNCAGATSFLSSSTDQITIRRSGSLSHFDHKWLRSISCLRTNHTNSILPY